VEGAEQELRARGGSPSALSVPQLRDIIRSRTGEKPVAPNNKRAADAAEGALVAECRTALVTRSTTLCPERSAQAAAGAQAIPRCPECDAPAADDGTDFKLDEAGVATCCACGAHVPACDSSREPSAACAPPHARRPRRPAESQPAVMIM
jgi:hypothetical protein